MSISPIRPEDCAQLLNCWNVAARHDPLSTDLLQEKIWNDPEYDAKLCLVDKDNSGLRAFAVGVIRKWSTGLRGHIKLLAVDPSFQNRGLGTRLLARLEKLFAGRSCHDIRLDEAAPNYLNPGSDVRYTKSWVFLEQKAYERFGETFNLTANLVDLELDTSTEERELQQKGIQIGRATKANATAVSAFLDSKWQDWQPEISYAMSRDPVPLHLALFGDQVIGFSAHSTNNQPLGWFGPMGTSPEHRGFGIGRILLLRCLADLKEQGHQRAIIPWVGPIPFYSRNCAAAVDRVSYRFRKRLSPSTNLP